MELTHRFTVPAGIERTWATFDDIESVAGCFPGAVVTAVDGEDFKGSCKVKLGPIALVYNGTGTFLEKDEAAKKFVVDAKGKDKRGNGTAAALVTATLSEAGSSTQVDVVTILGITGKPAQFGRGMIEDISNKLLGQFVACLEQKVNDGSPDIAPAASAAEAPAPDAQPEAESPVRSTPVVRSQPVNPPELDDALDLGATVLPILARAYWKQAIAGLAVVAVVVRLLRRR
ncbi:MAG: SRPBCC family protein [Nocardioidaceae bacterium]|nr:SRPBCC family protein [Nocardioidaceae bacterium]